MLAITTAALALMAQAAPIPLTRGSATQAEMTASDTAEATLRLRAGESADLVVEQQGIDVVVDLFGPDGTRLDSVDSPNGRQGPEPVRVIAREDGVYRLRIRPIAANEPRGRITIRVATLRGVAETRRLTARQQRARDAAARWFGRDNAPLPASGLIGAADELTPFDALAARATIIGLGEATHGSRELNDFRLALVQRLVARHNYRLIALEDSATRWRALEPYVGGRSATPAGALEWGWIGRRARRELLDWTRRWNLQHPGDAVRIIGVDPQDNGADRERLGAFLGRAYGAEAAAAWAAHAAELAAADEQTGVFGDSGTSAELRRFMREIVAQLSLDGPLLAAQLGEPDYHAALAAARDLAGFVDFNAGSGPFSHSRDWYMATALVRAMGETSSRPKAIYWGHNAHVSAAPTRWGPTGALLRRAFGCGYQAVATTFGAGAFIAQIPNDPDDRIATSRLAAAPSDEDRVETVLASLRPGTAHLSVWRCGEAPDDLPEWLRVERPLRWIGGLYAPDSAASAAYQPYRVTVAFDAIAYFPTVSAEDIPTDRPVVPPRRRP